MLVRKYLTGAEWLNNLMIILLYFVTGEFFAGLLGTAMGAGYFAIVVLMISGSYLARVYIERLPLYLAVHVLMYIVVIFIPLAFKFRIAAFMVLTVLSICNILFWTGSGERSFTRVHPILSLIFASVFIYASVKEAVYLGRISYICGICFLSLYFLRTYLINGAAFASGMLINKNTPIDEMFRHNSRLVFPLIGAFSAGMFLLQSDMFARGLLAAIRFIMNCIGRLISRILSLFPKTASEEEITVQPSGQLQLMPGSSMPIWFITMLEAIEKVTAVLIFGAIAYFLIKMIVRFFIIYFNKHGYEIMTVDHEDHTETRERIKHGKRKRPGFLLAGLSYKDKIRRKYRAAVIGMCRRGYGLRRDHTPAERIKDAADSFDGRIPEGFAELTGNYERVRYLD